MSKKLMAHLVYGYPDAKTSEYILREMMAFGIEYIEVQIPFSDPIADGPTLAQANSEASLRTSAIDVFSHLKALALNTSASKVVLMCYFQTIFSYGISHFCAEAAKTGVFGLIVPDVPFDQSDYEQLVTNCSANHLALVPVLSPNTSHMRMKQYLNTSTQLAYLTARTGITGTHTAKDELPKIRRAAQIIQTYAPTAELALGFGIQSVEDITSVPDDIDIVVVGSAITKSLIEQGKTEALTLINDLLEACHQI